MIMTILFTNCFTNIEMNLRKTNKMENKFTKIKYRVLQIAEHYRINKENFFKKIGMTSANFRGNAKETPLNSNAIENIITNYPEINLQWLLTGNGEMLNSQTVTKDTTISNTSDKNVLEVLRKELENKMEIISYLMDECRSKADEIKQLKVDLSMCIEREKKKELASRT